ncbi:hypothetical protein EDC04DRAFT_2606615 [Pisolithus marmoratus]|nr:hypothetical protein EDC04DRAFT_2606615 [Pisolithus marmoratus]
MVIDLNIWSIWLARAWGFGAPQVLGRYGALDACVLTKYNDHWITSLNVDYVPQPFIFEGARVELLCDRHMGHINCFQWPQVHAEHYIWSACIPQKLANLDNSTWKWMWWDVTQLVEDFVLERGSAFKVGRIHADKWKLLETVPPLQQPSEGGCLVAIMLTMSPVSEATPIHVPRYSDTYYIFIWRQYSHLLLDPSLIWKPNNVPEDIWCYPSDAHHLHTQEGAVIGLEQLVACPWAEPNAQSSSSTRKATLKMTSSNSNSNSKLVTCNLIVRKGKPIPYSAMAPMPTSMGSAASNPTSSSSPRAKPSITPNAKLWEDLDDPAIPPAMDMWHAALKDMNKDAKRVHPDALMIAYFFPHPALFVRDSSPITPHSWQDFLNMIPEQISSMFSGDQLCEAANLFSPELIRVQHDIPSQVQFWDISISLADLASMDQLMKSKILWDLYEHNFQFKLVALSCALMPSLSLNEESEWLDLVHQIFPGDLELTMCAEPFPGENQGLGSSDLQSKWFPSDLVEPLPPSALSACVWAVERKLAAFYSYSLSAVSFWCCLDSSCAKHLGVAASRPGLGVLIIVLQFGVAEPSSTTNLPR